MTPKLPPPANTKAVLVALVTSDTDQVLIAPRSWRRLMPRVIREVYSSAGAGGARPRTRIPPHVVPAKAGTHNHRRASLRRGGSPSVSKQSTAVAMGPGVRRDDGRS